MVYKTFNNVKPKLVVLFIAFLIWFFVKTEDYYNYSFHIPLRVTNLHENQVIENDIPQKITIACWGQGRDLFSFMLRKDIFYNLDVSKVQRSAKIFLNEDQIKFLRKTDIDVLNIVKPETVKVIISELVTKKVPIISKVNIQTYPGYTIVGEIKLEPDSVNIIATESEIKNISAVHTINKSYKNIKHDINKKIRLLDYSKKHVRLLASEVHLFADIQKLMERPISEINVEVINRPNNFKVTVIPSTLSLVLEGGTDLLLNITKQDISAYIDYEKVHNSKNKYHLAYIDAPEGTRYRDVKPKRFKIVVEKLR